MTRDELLLRLSLLVSEAELQQLSAEIAALPGDEAPAWLASLVRAADTLPLPHLPPVLASQLRAMFHGSEPNAAFDAQLVSDSRRSETLVGLRGEPDQSTGWTMHYTSDAGDLLVDAWERDDGRFDVDVQLLGPSEGLPACLVEWSGPVTGSAHSNEHGSAQIPGLPEGRYEIAAYNTALVIRAQLILP